jgi:hypothetical protein
MLAYTKLLEYTVNKGISAVVPFMSAKISASHETNVRDVLDKLMAEVQKTDKTKLN